MTKQLIPSYGGKKYLEQCPKISLKEIHQIVHTKLQEEMLRLEIGEGIRILYTKPHYGGYRAWFECPICKNKASILYEKNALYQCRTCTGLSYKKQRYRKMLEENIYKV